MFGDKCITRVRGLEPLTTVLETGMLPITPHPQFIHIIKKHSNPLKFVRAEITKGLSILRQDPPRKPEETLSTTKSSAVSRGKSLEPVKEFKNYFGILMTNTAGIRVIVHPDKKVSKLTVPHGVTCNFRKYQIEVMGPLGRIYLENLNLRREESRKYKQSNPEGFVNPLIPTFHRMLENAVIGVYYGYVLKLKIRGSGYKVIGIKGRTIILRLGHSHTCSLTVPPMVRAVCNRFNQILCYGLIKDKMTDFRERVLRLRQRNPYRAKGVFEVGEVLPAKVPGKAGRKG